MAFFHKNQILLVVIGRNEGKRLLSCLTSLKNFLPQIIYVDSGSTDQSVKNASNFGVTVVELNKNKPFTAARARNEGFEVGFRKWPSIHYVQFVDGDCEVIPEWIEKAYDFLESNPTVAVACGRRSEKFPNSSIYNKMCDIEWNTEVGPALSCGGDALIRASVFKVAKGYNPNLIAGEEPELCFRIKKLNYQIYRLDNAMTLHDANILYFSQWAKRVRRAGFAYANGRWIHAELYPNQIKNTLFYAFCVPLFSLFLLFFSNFLTGLIFFIFIQVYLILKVSFAYRKKGTLNSILLYSCFLTLAKYFQFLGLLDFYLHKILGKRRKLIEYK